MTTESSNDGALQVLERFYEAERKYMAAGGVAAGASFDDMAATLDPAIELHQTPDLPWGGEYVGHEGFRDWSIKMSDCFDYLDVREPRYFESGDTVVILCRLVTRSRRLGHEMDLPMAQVVKVRDGKIVEFRPFYWERAGVRAGGRRVKGQSRRLNCGFATPTQRLGFPSGIGKRLPMQCEGRLRVERVPTPFPSRHLRTLPLLKCGLRRSPKGPFRPRK